MGSCPGGGTRGQGHVGMSLSGPCASCLPHWTKVVMWPNLEAVWAGAARRH